ncbi:efflux RND transporter permease subunit [Arenimonas sp. GDDSR-1]|uniref:efflux RND transporter permease subunit n=1 Tax=Arenimonas sp. GDDSR-1 TaxID=2950125 RepID=UPI0026156918|nr:efflux RND transporter permease subunit [Arenimonas sp. GDDSR-1]
MKSLAELSLRRPVTAVMCFVSLVVIGLLAAVRLPLEQFPDINVPFVFVSVPYPGSTPQEVERQITRPVEEALSTLPGISMMNSTSRSDNAGIFLMFSDWDRDIAITASEARDRIDAIRSELPEDVQRYFVQKFSPNDEPLMRVRFASDRDLKNSYTLIQHAIQKRIERIPGVARVDITGAPPPEVEIAIDPVRLASHNVGLNELSAKLQSVNFSVSAGDINDRDRRIRVQPVGEIKTVEELRSLPLNDKGLRLDDIADVRFKLQRQDFGRRLDGRPAVGVDILREQNANLVNVADAIHAEIEKIKQDPELAGIKFIIVSDSAESVKSSIAELIEAGMIGSLLSIIVLFYFLRHWPSTLMVSLAIPICIVITLGVMYFTGMTLNVLSMMGLLLGIGMLVDNAVVVVESIYQYREKYPDNPMMCAIEGTKSVQLAISCGTLTSIIVFLPNLFGDKNFISIYLSQVALTITISLLASWLVAVSLIPMISARLKTPPAITQSHGFVPALTRRYEAFLAWTLANRRLSLLGILMIILVSMVPFKFTKFDMNSNEVGRELSMYFKWNGAYSLEQMSDEVAKVEQFMNENRERYQVKQVYVFFSEQGWGGMNLTLRDDLRSCGSFVSRSIRLVNPEYLCAMSSEQVQEMIRAEIPKFARAEVGFQGGGGPGGGGGGGQDNSVEIFLNGDSTEMLKKIGAEVIPVLAKQPELRDVRLNSGDENSEIRVSVDRDRAGALGFSAQDVAQYISIALRGTTLREFRKDDQEIPMWVRFAGAEQFRVEELSGLNLRRPDGTTVPLMSVINVEIRKGDSEIYRQDRLTSLSIKANKADNVTTEEAMAAFKKVLNNLPPGYSWSESQGGFNGGDAGGQMATNTLIALLMILIVMAALFESMLMPLAILTSILFSALGVFWLFALTGTTFSIMASIGILVLMGVVVNNGIVLFEHINALRRSGHARTEALIMGCKERLRPILMTMGTTILGMLPLCFGTTQIGGDGPAYYPMARAVVGGLAFSTIVSLIFLPTIYAALDDLRIKTGGVIARAKDKAPLRRFVKPA